MPRPPQIARRSLRIYRDSDGGGPVVRADAGRDAEAGGGIDAHGERGLVRARVVTDHLLQIERAAPFGRERETDEPARMHRHEVDQIRRDPLRRAHQVALVLAILVIGHDNEAAVTDVLDRPLDGSKQHLSLRAP